MTRPTPDRAHVLAEFEKLRRETTGTRVSVLALAKRIGLANTTFRRRFPDVVAQITAEQGTSPLQRPATSAPNSDDQLRQRNRELREKLELAVASIQRLTLENHRLRTELEAARGVISIRTTHKSLSSKPTR